MISHHHSCIFVHIPKTAGQSIEHAFLNWIGLSWETRAPLLMGENDQPLLGPPRLAHLSADQYVGCKHIPQTMFDAYFKFAIVRNPWSRMVSFYKYLGYQRTHSFRSFLLGDFRKHLLQERYWFVRPQRDYIYSADGDILVDYVGRFENLQSSFDVVCDKLGLPATELPRINASRDASTDLRAKLRQSAEDLWRTVKGHDISGYARYQDYYDAETIEYVAELYRPDIECFDYQFD